MRKVLSFCSMAAAAELPLVAQGGGDKPPEHYAWHLTTPVTEINSPVAEGRSIESPDELSQCIATVRPSTLGGNDIRASDRLSKNQPWITPQNLGAPVNTEFADFCPTPLDGRWLMFVSERSSEGTRNAGAGRGDIYLKRQGTFLYFSSTLTGNHDTYMSGQKADGNFEAPVTVTELNTEFDDRMPNASSDGLEVVFRSTRPTDANGTAAFSSFDV